MEDRTRRHSVPLRRPCIVETNRRAIEKGNAEPAPRGRHHRHTRLRATSPTSRDQTQPLRGLADRRRSLTHRTRQRHELEILRRHLPDRNR